MAISVRWANRHKKWAVKVLRQVKGRRLDPNHPDAIRAAHAVGFKVAMEIVTGIRESECRPSQDAMNRVVPGSYGSRQ